MSKAGKVGEGREAEGGGQNSGLGCPGTAEGAASGEAESGNEHEQGEREPRARSSPGSQGSRVPLGTVPSRPRCRVPPCCAAAALCASLSSELGYPALGDRHCLGGFPDRAPGAGAHSWLVCGARQAFWEL